MPLSSLKPEYLKRYKDLLRLLVKYGRSDFIRRIRTEGSFLDQGSTPKSEISKALELTSDLERLGPTYIKLGQFLSTRSDILPAAYLDALTRLQDRIQPFPYEQVEEIILAELNVRISKAFLNFEQKPLAAASLAQVHRASLHDGRLVAVKVQRPHIREEMLKDLEAFRVIAQVLDRYTEAGVRYGVTAIVDQFRRSTLRELDFRQEAQHLILMHNNLARFDRIIIPSPVMDYTTSSVLTMDYITGKKITSLSPLTRLEIDGAELAEELFKAYLQQILVDGFYHADPHPGNVFLTDTKSIALLDLGMVGYVSEKMQRDLLHLLLAVSEGRGDETVERAIEIGEITRDFDDRQFRNEVLDMVGQYRHSSIDQMAVGRVVLELSRITGENGFRFPSEIAILGKTLLNLDKVGRTLDPTFKPNLSIQKNASELLTLKIGKTLSPGRVYEGTMEALEFLEALPKRINQIVGGLANNTFKINLNAVDEKYLMTGLQKIANRLTAGIILAALVVGAALIIPVKTSLTILDYPAIAIIFFLLAGVGGVILLSNILFQDEKMKKKERSAEPR